MSELDTGVYLQIGIVSFGSKEGCNEGYPQVYTRVGFYQDWIVQIIRSSDDGLSKRGLKPPFMGLVISTCMIFLSVIMVFVSFCFLLKIFFSQFKIETKYRTIELPVMVSKLHIMCFLCPNATFDTKV